MAKKKRAKTTRKKTTRKKVATRKTGRMVARRGRPAGLSTYTREQLEAELRKRDAELEMRRDELLKELEDIDATLDNAAPAAPVKRSPGRLRGSGGGRKKTGHRGSRPRNKGSLAEALADVLKGKTLGVTEAAEAAIKSGYKTNAANFRTIVNQTLLKRGDLFKKVGRGQYTSK
jgi:hypothetical protein